MTSEFQKMRGDSEAKRKLITRAVAQAHREQHDRVAGYHSRPRVIDALTSTGRSKLADKISSCRHTARCQSLWCGRCRATAVAAVKKQMVRKTTELHEHYLASSGHHLVGGEAAYDAYMNGQVLHVSGLVGLFGMTPEAVKTGLKFDRARWKRIRERKASIPFWLVGNYELELVNYRALMHDANEESSKKKLQVRQLSVFSKSQGWIRGGEDAVVLLHWHGITNATRNGLAEAVDEDYLIAGKKLYKTQDCGLYVQAFHTEKTFQQNLDQVASYAIKNPTRYKHSFVGSDVGNEPMLKRELSDLVALYDEVQGRNWRTLLIKNSVGG